MEWITGAEILELPDWGLEADLIDAYKKWLCPRREVDRAMMTPNSKCFNCTKAKASRGYMPGYLDEQGACIPIMLPDMPNISPFPPFAPQGIGGLYPPLELALKIDPALVECFFDEGEFVFDSGVFNEHIHPSVFRLLTGTLGSSVVERLMLEGVCKDFDPMGALDMGNRLKAARFRLKDVKAYGHRDGIGQGGAGQVEETEAPESMQPEVESEPTNAAEYAAWRRATIRSIHNGQLMLEIQERWGKPPLKTLTREEIAALVLEQGAPPPNKKADGSRWESLKSAFKNNVYSYRKQLKQEAD